MHKPAELELVGLAVEAMQPGGAAVGIVDDATSGAAVLLGKRVLVPPLDPCGQCEVCRRGGAPVCPAAQPRQPGRRIRVASRWVVALAGGLDLAVPAAAAVAGDVTTAYTLYARTGLGPRDPVVIAGTSAVTRFLVEILRAKGMTPVVVVDGGPSDWPAWLAARGASVVHDASAVATAISAQGAGARPLRLIATTSAGLAIATALAGPRATLTALATAADAALPASLLASEVTIIGVAGPHPDLIVESAAMCAKGEIDLNGGVTTDRDDVTRAQLVEPS